MWAALDLGYWFCLLLAVPAAGLLVRLFMIQHDCGHGAFFRHRLANDWVGRVFGVLTLTPYDFWRRTHAIHHASSGNLDQRGIGDIDTLTVREYLALSRWGRLRYRLYRHPIIMFGIGPAYLFLLQHRLPVGLMRGGWQPWLSTMATNAAIAVRHRYRDMVCRRRCRSCWCTCRSCSSRHPSGSGCSTSSTSSRDILGRGPGLERACRRVARQLPLRLAGRPALVHGQYRRASRPPPLQPNSLLPAA